MGYNLYPVDGVPDDSEIERLRANIPLQKQAASVNANSACRGPTGQ